MLVSLIGIFSSQCRGSVIVTFRGHTHMFMFDVVYGNKFITDALHYLLNNIFIRLSSKLYRQIVGIPMGTNCAPLVADLFLLCYERDFMLSLSDNNQTDGGLALKLLTQSRDI